MGGGGPPLTRPPPSAASGGMTVSQHTQLWLRVCSCLTLSPFDVSMCVVGGGGQNMFAMCDNVHMCVHICGILCSGTAALWAHLSRF